MRSLFLIVGEEQSAMERTVQESQPSHSKYKKNTEMLQVQAANARTHSGKMPTTHGRIDVFLSVLFFH